jgi:FMN phosphatase YigB (HAD superfamily)
VGGLAMKNKNLVVTDLDNTLFDWVEVWYQSFSAMLDEISRISEISKDSLIPDIKAIHRRHGTSEYAFLIEEIPSITKKFPKADLLRLFEPALHAYRKKRKQYLQLFPTVLESLRRLKNNGVTIVGYTESMAYYSSYRIKRTSLDGVLDYIYSPPDHDIPKDIPAELLRRYPASYYELEATVHRPTPIGLLKPNAEILLSIIDQVKIRPDKTVYIGDSLMKDIAMAQDAGIDNAWAKYGTAHERPEYGLLQAVTHWSDEDVRREQELQRADIQPTVILENEFADIFNFFDLQGI